MSGEYEPIHSSVQRTQSRLGMVSCGFAGAGAALLFWTSHLAFQGSYAESESGFNFTLSNSLDRAAELGLLVWFLAGTALAIAGLLQRDRKKVFAWIGLVLGAVLSALYGVFIAIGISQGGLG